MKKRVNLKHSAFYWCEVKVSFRSIKHIEQKLIGPEITQAVGIELRKLGSYVINHGIKSGCSLGNLCLYH